MWPYRDHDEEEYNRVLRFVEEYAVSLGAELVGSKEETFTTFAGDLQVRETLDMRIYRFGDEYYWVEHHFLPDRPFMVFSFGDSVETVGSDDAEPFPYDLTEEEQKAEVRYSLGLEAYPE